MDVIEFIVNLRVYTLQGSIVSFACSILFALLKIFIDIICYLLSTRVQNFFNKTKYFLDKLSTISIKIAKVCGCIFIICFLAYNISPVLAEKIIEKGLGLPCIFYLFQDNQ